MSGRSPNAPFVTVLLNGNEDPVVHVLLPKIDADGIQMSCGLRGSEGHDQSAR